MAKGNAHRAHIQTRRGTVPGVEMTFEVRDEQLIGKNVEQIAETVKQMAMFYLYGYKSTLIDEDVDTNPHL